MNNYVVIKKSPLQGKGIFANKNFQKNEYILTIDDSHIVNDESKLTPKQHAFDLDYFDNKIILMQAPEKYINHSCDPNVYIKTIKDIRQVFSMKKINKGEELTFDYSINGDNDGTFLCHCKTNICRKIYQGNFFKLPLNIQNKYLPYLDNWFIKKYKDQIKKIKLH